MVFAACTAVANAQEIQLSDRGGAAARLGIVGKAERIVHHDKPYVLVQLTVQNIRMIDRGEGRTDWVKVGEGGPAFLPVTIACDTATLEADGKRLKAHALSPCGEPLRVDAPFATPVFIVFSLPRPGPATLTIPVSVSAPAPAVAARRDAAPPATAPATAADGLIGERTIALQLLVTDAKR